MAPAEHPPTAWPRRESEATAAAPCAEASTLETLCSQPGCSTTSSPRPRRRARRRSNSNRCAPPFLASKSGRLGAASGTASAHRDLCVLSSALTCGRGKGRSKIFVNEQIARPFSSVHGLLGALARSPEANTAFFTRPAQPEASSSQPQGSAALPASPPAVAARPASARCQARPHAAHWGFEFCGDDAFEFLVPASPQLRSH